MPTYRATFSNGRTITRKSDRVYTHGWRAQTSYLNQVKFGFAADERKAHAAARAFFSPKYFKNSQITIEVVPVTTENV